MSGVALPSEAKAAYSPYPDLNIAKINLAERIRGLAKKPADEPADSYQVRFYGPSIPPTISEELLSICQERGYGQDCAQTLLGMVWKESNFIGTAVGDNGKALGYFQIHYRVHGVDKGCAQNLRCSANWTIDYLEYNGYPRSKMWAIQCHNGCAAGNGYSWSVQRHGKRLWPKAQKSRSLALR